MVRGIFFFLWLASSWAVLAADRAAAQTLPDGCPDLQGTYYCDGWNLYHQSQDGHFQRFERIPDPDPARNITIYRVFKYDYDSSDEEAKKQGGLLAYLLDQPEAVSSEEAKKRGAIFVADGKKKWRDKDHSIVKCEEGVLNFYLEQDIEKTRASWYFRDDILVKKIFKESRYWGRVLLDQTYPCKRVEGDPEAASGCNNHWCSWAMDQETVNCYDRLCRHQKKRLPCFYARCANKDWSKPTARSAALDRLDEAVEERKTKTDTPHDVAPAP